MPEHISPLPFFRVHLVLAGMVILILGLINPYTTPEFIDPWLERGFVAGLCFFFVAMTYGSLAFRRRAVWGFYGVLYSVSLWYIHLSYLNGLSFNTAFGTVMVMFGCSIGFQTTRALGSYVLMMLTGVVTVALLVEAPQTEPSFYIRTVGVIGLFSFFALRSRLRLRDEVRRGEDLMRSIFEEATDAMLLLDAHTRAVVRANERAHSLFGTETCAALQRLVFGPVTTHVPGEAFPGPGEHERHFHRADGDPFWGSMAVRSLSSAGRALVLLRIADITMRKHNEQVKDDFISVVNHELRTPMTSILGSLGLLLGGLGGTLPAHATTMLQIAHRNCERLLRLINDMLDVQKIASGNIVLSIEEQPLALLMRQALESAEGYGSLHRVRFVLTDTDPSVQVRIDPDRMLQVMSNLFSNAAKFSPTDGTVEVGWHRQEAHVRIFVKDNGPGIPEAFRAQLFDKFTQAIGANQGAKTGTGLGLNITRSLVEMHNGQIGFETKMDVGTTFYVTLPLPAPTPPVRVGHRQAARV